MTLPVWARCVLFAIAKGGFGTVVLGAIPCIVRADEVAGAVYVRSDSDDTVVVSPRARATAHVAEPTRVDLTYTADIWTSASIDIRASASKPVTEQRNELDAALSHDLGELTLGASYRYSVENDYESHGGTAAARLELADNSSTIGLDVFGFRDAVGRSGSEIFSRPLTTLGARASFTQILDPDTFALLTYEIGRLQGYQASPYRFVGAGPSATGFGCIGAAQCLREHVPETRLRHAFALLARRALGDTFSIGAEYRFYLDDWEQRSHTVAAQLGLFASQNALFTLRYRFYTQAGVWFYARVYTAPVDTSAFITRDREQSPMQNHRVSLDLEQRVDLRSKSALLFNLQAAGVFYSYSNFAGLEAVSALEVTLAVALEN